MFGEIAHIKRRVTHEVGIGGVHIGARHPIVVQSMTNTPTADVATSVAQCLRLVAAGADLIRLTTQGAKEVAALSEIKARLRDQGIGIPLIADVHFSPEVALAAAAVADKVRINPGNFAPNLAAGEAPLRKLIEQCQKHHCALRLGVNHGSLGADAMERFGDSPQGMSYLAMQWLERCQKLGFQQIVVSMKSSNTRVMTQAYRLLATDMAAAGLTFPLHLGLTEAGNGREGRLKAAVALSSLLYQGLGDTLRVSLTEAPENEIPVGRAILSRVEQHPPLSAPVDIHTPLRLHYELPNLEALSVATGCDAGPLLLDQKAKEVEISATINSEVLSRDFCLDFENDLLQAARCRFSKPEYIACPGCGRTLFDLEQTLEEVKRATAHLKGLSIAVMGCIVNGPGEMADADYGYVGAGPGKVSLYKGKNCVLHNIPQEEALSSLLKLIEIYEKD